MLTPKRQKKIPQDNSGIFPGQFLQMLAECHIPWAACLCCMSSKSQYLATQMSSRGYLTPSPPQPPMTVICWGFILVQPTHICQAFQTLHLSELLLRVAYCVLLPMQAREGWMLDDDERMSAAVIAKQKGLKRYEVDAWSISLFHLRHAVLE